MAERPILFSGEMVRAILDGRKTQTRRVIKPQPIAVGPIHGRPIWQDKQRRCPYGAPGDTLWVRETWQAPHHPGTKPSEIPEYAKVVYRADGQHWSHWRPSIFMPRWASRITLRVTNVCVERVRSITPQDAIDEGVVIKQRRGRMDEEAIWEFQDLWNSINAKRGYSWDSNPWVWVVEFEKVEVL